MHSTKKFAATKLSRYLNNVLNEIVRHYVLAQLDIVETFVKRCRRYALFQFF